MPGDVLSILVGHELAHAFLIATGGNAGDEAATNALAESWGFSIERLRAWHHPE